MTREVGGNASESDEPTDAPITINSTTAVDLFAATNDFIQRTIINYNSQGYWLRKKTAATDNNKDGVFVPKYTMVIITDFRKFSGPLSAVADVGSFDVLTEEF